MKKQSLFTGAIILGLSGILIRFIGVFFRFPIILLIGDEGIGYYQLSYPFYMFYVALLSGIPIAMSKMIAENKKVDKIIYAIEVKREAIKYIGMFGFLFSISIMIFAKDIIRIFSWDAKSYYSILAIGIAPFLISIVNIYRGFFQGFQNVIPTAISQAIEQILRIVVGVSLTLFLLKYGIEYAAAGASFATAAGAFGGIVYLFLKFNKEYKKVKIIQKDNTIIKKLIKISIPISIGATVVSLMTLSDAFLIPKLLLNSGIDKKMALMIFGQYTGKANVIINIPLTLTVALSTSLVPIISKYHNRKDIELVEKKIIDVLKLTLVIAIPATMGIFLLSTSILYMLFPGNGDGGVILKYMSLTLPFVMMTQVMTSILQSVGKLYDPVINLFIGIVIRTFIMIALVKNPSINIYGAIIASVIAYFIIFLLDYRILRRKLKIKIDFKKLVIKPIMASSIMIISICFFNKYISIVTKNIYIITSTSVLLGIIVYGIFVIVFKIFDIRVLRKQIKHITWFS